MKKQLVIALLSISTLTLLSGCWGKKAEEPTVQAAAEETTTSEAKETIEPTTAEQQPAAE